MYGAYDPSYNPEVLNSKERREVAPDSLEGQRAAAWDNFANEMATEQGAEEIATSTNDGLIDAYPPEASAKTVEVPEQKLNQGIVGQEVVQEQNAGAGADLEGAYQNLRGSISNADLQQAVTKEQPEIQKVENKMGQQTAYTDESENVNNYAQSVEADNDVRAASLKALDAKAKAEHATAAIKAETNNSESLAEDALAAATSAQTTAETAETAIDRLADTDKDDMAANRELISQAKEMAANARAQITAAKEDSQPIVAEEQTDYDIIIDNDMPAPENDATTNSDEEQPTSAQNLFEFNNQSTTSQETNSTNSAESSANDQSALLNPELTKVDNAERRKLKITPTEQADLTPEDLK